MVPELKVLFEDTKKKLSWDRNTYVRKQLTFIYFYVDFSSPLRDWKDDVRKEESLRYSELEIADVSTPRMIAATEAYRRILIESCRALKTYHASLKGLDAMDSYLNNVDFTKVDKQGKAIYTPNQFAANLALSNKAYDELAKLANRVSQELEQNAGIRGKAEMGDSEVKAANSLESMTDVTWDETVIAPDGRTKWTDIQGLLERKQDTDVA